MSSTYVPVAARPAPARARGPLIWARNNLFANHWSALATLICLALALWLVPRAANWAVLHAVFRPDADACQAARGVGACWGVIGEKYRLILFGRYPYDLQWRPLVATLLLLTGLGASCAPTFWRRGLVLLWLPILLVYFALMRGGVLGLSYVRTDLWGGLPLTVLLASLSIFIAFPLAILAALGRRSRMPAISAACTVYIELIRGVPLISVLFMATFMLPLFMPQGFNVDVLVRVVIGISIFAAAYLAEIIRGGLQAVPKGQLEAADSLGLSYWQCHRKVVLPQALTTVVPSIMNNFIAIFKDTSLVVIVSIYELTGALSLALNSDVNWRPFKIESYLFIALIYFGFCFAISRYSLWVEGRMNAAKAR